MGEIVKTGFKLFLITAIASMALGLTNAATFGRIEEQTELARIAAKSYVLPQAVEFVQLNIDEFRDLHPLLLEVHKGVTVEEVQGYTFRVKSEGFAEMELYVGIDNAGKISGVNVVYQRETPGLGSRATDKSFTGQFSGMEAQSPFEVVKRLPADDEIQAISGATTSSRAVVDAINASIEFYNVQLKDGDLN